MIREASHDRKHWHKFHGLTIEQAAIRLASGVYVDESGIDVYVRGEGEQERQIRVVRKTVYECVNLRQGADDET